MSDFETEIKIEFLNEALMNLEEVEGSFMELESATDPKPLLDKIFRLAHNLKGGSRAVGFGQVAEFTHELENLVLKLQKGDIQLSSKVITTLLRSNDRLVEMLSELKVNNAATFQSADIIDEIKGWLSGNNVAESSPAEVVTPTPAPVVSQAPSSSSPSIPDATAFFGEVAPPEVVAPVLAPVAVEASTPAPTASPVTKATENRLKDDEVIRVSLSKIDILNDYVGELIVLQSVVQQQGTLGNSPRLQLSLRQLSKISKDIQNLSMSLRMLPVKPLIQKLQRVVRDTAQALNKDVSLEVIGDQLDIDKSVLDRLADPLIHILRNAVDHGLETREERVDAAKPTCGVVTLSFANEGNHLLVEVKDDGKGINGEVLRRKAAEKGLIREGQSMTEKQLVHLIFHPGFSTKTETSEISGRGVGMDVVKTNVETIGGTVDVTTEVGRGSQFKIQIPLSLAVIEGLIVKSETSRYVVPLSQVQETVNLKSQKLHNKLGIGTCFELRGEVVPLVSVEKALGARDEEADPNGTALIVNVGDQSIGLVVSDILRAQQIVIKPFSIGLTPQKGWIGSCVLGDGLPTLIISPIDLLRGKIVNMQSEQLLGGVS